MDERHSGGIAVMADLCNMGCCIVSTFVNLYIGYDSIFLTDIGDVFRILRDIFLR